jgi:predicted DNA-binding transcriptional regulator YafY
VTRALADRRLLEIGYQDRRGAASYRAVEPVCLLTVDHRWYLVGWCRLRGDHRASRLDRIGTAEMRLEPVPHRQRPDLGCDLPIRVRELTLGG